MTMSLSRFDFPEVKCTVPIQMLMEAGAISVTFPVTALLQGFKLSLTRQGASK